MTRAIVGVSVAVIVVIGALMRSGGKAPVGAEPGVLSTVNALLNGAATLCLIAGYIFIRHGRVAAHRASMLTALAISVAFLVTYVLHHVQVGSVPFPGTGAWRGVYFAILIPHVVLAAPVLPLALLTVYRGWTGRIELHRRIARWTLPLWLYVSLSGVVVYFMLYHVEW